MRWSIFHQDEETSADPADHRAALRERPGAKRRSLKNGSPGWVVGRVPLANDDSRVEERANFATHGIAFLWSLAACALLVVAGGRLGGPVSIVAFLVYGLSLVNLYAVSTIYHLVRLHAFKQLFRLLDHVSIFLLIAGTYTPVLMLYYHGELRWIMLGIEWGFVLLGTAYKVFFLGRLRILSVFFYLVMGWLAIGLWHQHGIPEAVGLAPWIIAGGLCYTAGLTFYATKRLRFHHALWHLFVMAGSILHFVGIYRTAVLLTPH